MNNKYSKLEILAYIITALGLLVMSVFVICLSSSYKIGGNLSNDEMAITGQVGDFMGGVIGSLWALAGVFLYFSAIKMQNKELENQSKFRREDRILDSIKEFENTFFALLASQQRIKDELSADFYDAKFDDNHKLCEDKIHASGNNFFYELFKDGEHFCAMSGFIGQMNSEMLHDMEMSAEDMLIGENVTAEEVTDMFGVDAPQIIEDKNVESVPNIESVEYEEMEM